MARKLGPLLIGALLASLALVGVDPAPAGAQEAGVPVHLVHGSPDALGGQHPALAVSVDGQPVATLEYGTPVDIVVQPGSRTFSVEASGGLLPVPVPIPDTTATLAAGNGYTVVVSGDGTLLDLTTEILVFENDLSPISTGVGRFTFNNAHFWLGVGGLGPGATVDFGDAGSIDGVGYGEGGSIELPEGRYDAEIEVFPGVGDDAEIPIVGGVHIIVTLIQGTDSETPIDEPVTATAQDLEVVFLVQELPEPDTDVEAFCGVLLSLAGLGEELFAALDTIGTPQQLGQEEWRALFGQVDELLAQGDATRDLAVDDAWQAVTAQIRMVRAAFALVDYDLESEDGQQVAAEIQAALAEGDGDGDGEDPAMAALTEYVVTTCFAAPPAAPEEEPAPPAPAPPAEQPTLPRTGAPAALAALAGVLALAGLASRSLLRRSAI